MAINLSRQKTNVNFFHQNHREISIGFCALLVLIVSLIFPVKAGGESFWLSLFLFLVFPFLVIRYLLKESPAIFGLSWGDQKKGMVFGAIFTVAFIFINYLVVSRPELRNLLTLPRGIASNFWYFLFFELLIILPVHFFWEFFFRGFVQLGLEKKLGAYSLLLQALLQTLLVVRSSWIIIFLILFSSLSAGVIARQSRSVAYSFVSMWLISVSLDIMLIRIITKG